MWLIVQSSKDKNPYPHHTNQDQEEEEEDNTHVWIKDTNLHKKNRKLIKRGYVLHIPIKKKKRGEEEDHE